MGTQIQMVPPKPPSDKLILAGFPDDFIKEMADNIASLSGKEAKELSDYLEKEDL